ncbi:MAG: M42 family metallopeptidase [Anaerorhabdus sp.]
MKFNTKYIQEFATKILAIDSPAGYTKEAVAFLKKEAEEMGYKTQLTQKGNLIVEVGGKKKAARAVCAHVDTLGLMVRSIKADGKLSVTMVGGPLMNTLNGEYCRIYTRSKKVYTGTILSTSPSVHVYPDAKTLISEDKTMEVRLDEVVQSKEDVEKLGIMNGDFIAIDTKTEITPSGFIKSRFLDDKLSVAILFGVLKELRKKILKQKTYFIFTVYEEVGHGNSYLPSDVEEVLGVDMGCIGADLACTEYDVSICAKDSHGPYDYEMTTHLTELAKSQKINYVVDIYPFYGSDVSAALSSSNNIKGALIGPGVHASHGMERSHMDAVESCAILLMSYCLG